MQPAAPPLAASGTRYPHGVLSHPTRQREQLHSQLDYWQQQLAGIPALLELPTDRPRPAVQSLRSATQRFALPATLAARLEALSGQQGVTLFVVLLAAFQTLLARYTGQEDIGVGTPILAPAGAEPEETGGADENILVLRADLAGDPTVHTLLRRVRAVVGEAYAHRDVPFEQLIEVLQPAWDRSHAPLVQVLFVLENASSRASQRAGRTVHAGEAALDLCLSIQDGPEGLLGTVAYNCDLFEAGTITRLCRHYQTLLEGIADHPEWPISALPLLTPAEREQILVAWNRTAATYPPDRCVHELFEAQVERTPDAVAVACQHEQVTYRELNQRANQVAHHLRALGVGPEVCVGICMERSLEFAAGLLGILKAGGVYVPLDPDYPRERLAVMLEETRVRVLLTQERLAAGLPTHEAQVICLDADEAAIARECTANPVSEVGADNLAYIIFTSGTTAGPRGVLIPHRALANHSRALIDRYGLGPADRVLQFAALNFDVALEEIVPSWLSGATVVFRPNKVVGFLAHFLSFVRNERITVLNLPASFWHTWVLALQRTGAPLPSSLRIVIVGNEKVLPERVALWVALGGDAIRWCNAYGTTEATITTTTYELQGHPLGSSVPVGRPIANTETYILDRHLNPVPIGVTGDLYVGGLGLARGYLNRPELTARAFIPHPFDTTPGARLYRTGDLARYLPDGQIDVLGRRDHQVKIRGFRIEPEEIASVLSRHPAVRESAVLASKDARGEQRLVAYVVLDHAPADHGKRIEIWPSLGEYLAYDRVLYRAMTNDTHRNKRYQAAINRAVGGKVVVDIGTGKDAVLARFCAQAGAAKVYAIEMLDEAYEQAVTCVKNLGLQETITVIHGDAMTLDLPEKVDVCVSELIGTIGSSEGAATVLGRARRFLKPDGVMIPQRCMTRFAAVCLPADVRNDPCFSRLAARYVQRMFERHGQPFDPRLCVKHFPVANLISDAQTFEDLDFRGHTGLPGRGDVRLTVARDARLDGFLLCRNLYVAEDQMIDTLA